MFDSRQEYSLVLELFNKAFQLYDRMTVKHRDDDTILCVSEQVSSEGVKLAYGVEVTARNSDTNSASLYNHFILITL